MTKRRFDEGPSADRRFARVLSFLANRDRDAHIEAIDAADTTEMEHPYRLSTNGINARNFRSKAMMHKLTYGDDLNESVRAMYAVVGPIIDFSDRSDDLATRPARTISYLRIIETDTHTMFEIGCEFTGIYYCLLDSSLARAELSIEMLEDLFEMALAEAWGVPIIRVSLRTNMTAVVESEIVTVLRRRK